MSAVDCLVLAGGALERERFPGLDGAIPRKAGIPLLGRPMIEWTVRGLRACPRIERVVVVGHEALETAALREMGAAVVPETGEIAGNLRRGLDSLEGADRVLAVSGDLPLLTGEALEDLLGRAPRADVVFPIVERADVLRRFPAREWVFAATAEGRFTGSSACLCGREAVTARWRWVEELLEARRKRPLSLAMLFGLPLAVKLLSGRLRIEEAETRVSALLQLSGRAFRTPFAELALDVDKAADIPLVEEELRRRGE